VPGYTIDGRPDGVLKNKLGVTSRDELEQLEADYVHWRLVELQLSGGPPGDFDAEHLKAIHRHLFRDVYEWAGHTRDERLRLSDGVIASEPVMRKAAGATFVIGPSIPAALDELARTLRQADHLRGLSREEFAFRAADTMSEINAIHPFREGNGRTQRVFIEELAKQAGHPLDFMVVSHERMVWASIAAHEQSDPSMMRRLFDEISNPARVAPLRQAIEFLDGRRFPWNDHYIATTEPGYQVELVLVGIAGDNFMARTKSDILVGRSSDLPQPCPEQGKAFTFIASEDCWK
jgi:cell filamentation protein